MCLNNGLFIHQARTISGILGLSTLYFDSGYSTTSKTQQSFSNNKPDSNIEFYPNPAIDQMSDWLEIGINSQGVYLYRLTVGSDQTGIGCGFLRAGKVVVMR
jgi:hypothetical protein